MEKNIYDITMINEEDSSALSIDGDFEFSDINTPHVELAQLHKQTKKFDTGFIHFERAYKLSDGVMLRISMGSFDRPEHLYLIIEDKKAKYFPSLPLKSKSNLAAHKFLHGLLNG
jgi:tRNA (guanine-N7-)-methyltransferase